MSASDEVARLFEGLSRAFQQDYTGTKPGEWAAREGNPWTPRIREM